MIDIQDINNLNNVILSSKEIPIIIDCWADWCIPCKIASPVFEKLENEYKGKMKFFKLDVEKNNEMVSMLNIMSIPTFIIFKDKKIFNSFSGFSGEKELKEKIDKAILDE